LARGTVDDTLERWMQATGSRVESSLQLDRTQRELSAQCGMVGVVELSELVILIELFDRLEQAKALEAKLTDTAFVFGLFVQAMFFWRSAQRLDHREHLPQHIHQGDGGQ